MPVAAALGAGFNSREPAKGARSEVATFAEDVTSVTQVHCGHRVASVGLNKARRGGNAMAGGKVSDADFCPCLHLTASTLYRGYK